MADFIQEDAKVIATWEHRDAVPAGEAYIAVAGPPGAREVAAHSMQLDFVKHSIAQMQLVDPAVYRYDPVLQQWEKAA